MDYDAEIRDLKRRVGELEGGFGFLTNQVRDVHRDLLGFQQAAEQRFDKVDRRFNSVDQRFDGVDRRFDKLDQKVDRLDSKIEGIDAKVDALPHALAETMREVLGKG